MLTGYIAVRFKGEEWHACEPRINVSEDELTLQWHGMLIIQKEQPGSSFYDALHCKDNLEALYNKICESLSGRMLVKFWSRSKRKLHSTWIVCLSSK